MKPPGPIGSSSSGLGGEAAGEAAPEVVAGAAGIGAGLSWAAVAGGAAAVPVAGLFRDAIFARAVSANRPVG